MSEQQSENLCADCGVCCRAFLYTPQGEHDKKKYIAMDRLREYYWQRNDLIPISEEEVLALNIIDPGSVVRTISYGCQYFKCRLYDEDTGLCRDHDNRPTACRDFPADLAIRSTYLSGCKFGDEKFLVKPGVAVEEEVHDKALA